MSASETNFDGIPGPTHNYAGLSIGNLASQAHTNQPSNPRQAALQGLAKMKFLADLGIAQAVLPPHERPDIFALRRLGFAGSDAQILQAASRYPMLLASCGSASAMWAANAATVSPSADAADHRVHFTPANMPTQFHRSLEAPTTAAILKAIFKDESAFAHHAPLPTVSHFADEGAANHTRLCASYDQRTVGNLRLRPSGIFKSNRHGAVSPLARHGKHRNPSPGFTSSIRKTFCFYSKIRWPSTPGRFTTMWLPWGI